jgi:hypothetical protein
VPVVERGERAGVGTRLFAKVWRLGVNDSFITDRLPAVSATVSVILASRVRGSLSRCRRERRVPSMPERMPRARRRS